MYSISWPVPGLLRSVLKTNQWSFQNSPSNPITWNIASNLCLAPWVFHSVPITLSLRYLHVCILSLFCIASRYLHGVFLFVFKLYERSTQHIVSHYAAGVPHWSAGSGESFPSLLYTVPVCDCPPACKALCSARPVRPHLPSDLSSGVCFLRRCSFWCIPGRVLFVVGSRDTTCVCLGAGTHSSCVTFARLFRLWLLAQLWAPSEQASWLCLVAIRFSQLLGDGERAVELLLVWRNEEKGGWWEKEMLLSVERYTSLNSLNDNDVKLVLLFFIYIANLYY